VELLLLKKSSQSKNSSSDSGIYRNGLRSPDFLISPIMNMRNIGKASIAATFKMVNSRIKFHNPPNIQLKNPIIFGIISSYKNYKYKL